MKKIILIYVLVLSTFSFAQKKDKVLATVNNEVITVSEFIKVYEKNLDAIDNEESKDVKNNLDLYINYKLKVNEAYDIMLDTLPSYQKEINSYRVQLSAPYLQDSSFINKLVKDAYFRTKNEIKAKHILVRIPKLATPKDTLEAFDKINEIRKRVINGEDFEKVAYEVSEDPSAREFNGRKANKGNLGYFTAFKMVYPFENAAYNTKVGEVSTPFKTRFGYHIVKVDTIRASKGQVEVSHILIKDLSENGENKIMEVYNKLENDQQFGSLAETYSDDMGSKSKDGKLRKFGTGVMVEDFEEVAFSLENEGDYSKPFKTKFGWHIIKLNKKYPVKSFDEEKFDLERRVKSSSRAQLSQKAVIEKLKKIYNITQIDSAKEIFNLELSKIPSDSLQSIILLINEKKITQKEFVDFAKNRKDKPVYELFNDFKDDEILDYYKENLEKSEPEFASTLKEYKDGILLFELMQQKIWNKSLKDSLGLNQYFQNNLSSYTTNNIDEIKGEVMNDYQNYLEENWISELRDNSKITINTRQLNKLVRRYNKSK